MRKKGVDGIGDYEDSFSPVPHASGFRTILALATMWNMMTDHVPSCKVSSCQVMVTMGRFIFPLHQAMMKIRNM